MGYPFQPKETTGLRRDFGAENLARLRTSPGERHLLATQVTESEC